MLENTLAVINCKKTKRNIACEASKMYAGSSMFRAMRDFVEAYYDSYVILSAKYGVVLPDQIIEPYSQMIKSTGYAGKNETNILTESEKAVWIAEVLDHPVWKKYAHIDFHLSKNYWELLEPHFSAKSNTKVILLPPNTGFVVRHYQWLLRDYNENKPIDFTFRDRPGMPAHPDRTWYHPIHGTFFGNEWALYQKYGKVQKLDLPTLDMVNNGKKNEVQHHKGWCLKFDILKRLYFDGNRNQWRLSNLRDKPLFKNFTGTRSLK